MKKFLLILFLLLPVAGFTQTSYTLPDGSRLQAYLAIPDDFDGEAPLAIVMGGGAGNGRIASGTFESLGQEFVDRGWAVATPVSPDGQSFFAGNGEKVRQLITLLKARDDIADGSVLLSGISNGGISSLQIASSHPDEYLGVVAVPAIANDTTVSNLTNFPVYLRIGSEDQLGWANRFDSTVRALESAGSIVNALLVEGGGHRVPIDWDNLEQWLETVK
jgi:poly(3-hydroxybutyrate) depolymerase